jgi:hypothetical protein
MDAHETLLAIRDVIEHTDHDLVAEETEALVRDYLADPADDAAAQLALLRSRLLLYATQLERVSMPVVRGPHGDGMAAARAETAVILRGILDGQAPPPEAGRHSWEQDRGGVRPVEESAPQQPGRTVEELHLPE